MAVVVSTVSTVSEQQRNRKGQASRWEVIPRPSGHYAARRLSRETRVRVENCKQSGFNDGKRLLFAYPFLDVAAFMDLLYISRYSAVRPTLHSQVHHNVTTSFSQYIWSSSVSLALYFSF